MRLSQFKVEIDNLQMHFDSTRVGVLPISIVQKHKASSLGLFHHNRASLWVATGLLLKKKIYIYPKSYIFLRIIFVILWQIS